MKKLYEELCEDYTHNFIPRKEIKADPKIEDLIKILDYEEFNSQTRINSLLFFYFRLLFFKKFQEEFLSENGKAEKILVNFHVDLFSFSEMGRRMLLLLRLEFMPELILNHRLYEAFSRPENWDSEIAIKAYNEYNKRKQTS